MRAPYAHMETHKHAYVDVQTGTGTGIATDTGGPSVDTIYKTLYESLSGFRKLLEIVEN